MTLRHLEIFVIVADTLNMSEAAEKLFIAQPSVSQAISELERHFRTKLFERLNRGLTLTQPGSVLLSYARHISRLVNEAERSMKDLSSGGTLRIGATVTIGTTIMSGILIKFRKMFPRSETFFRIDNTGAIEAMLLADEIDVALIEGETASAYLESVPFMDDEMVLILPRGHEWERKRRIRASDLKGRAFLTREERSGTGELFRSVMEANKIDYAVSGVLNNNEAIKSAVKAGLGISVVSRLSVMDELKRGEFSSVKIEDIRFVRSFRIVYHRNKYITRMMSGFIDLCAGGR